ncbi:NADH-quinone oxidoreductase subunit NuoE [Rhodobacter lacus]|uniref:NADH-quinone oxidoreductase subunit NuoE n=1 Tax=Rhodobacter lacus TaxID=1641972 RepID=A0ABW5A3E2_9RHOB
MLRRLHHEQPASFAFTPANRAWAEAQMTKYPEGRQASAIIPLLFRAQEQEGWLTKPAIEHVADMLGLPYIRALEVATFYFMFQLAPVGSVAHIQVCGTTSCMICGAEDLIAVCKRKIAAEPFALSADGKLSWEEVECLGACANAPMAQIGKDYFEDLTEESLEKLIDRLAAGEAPQPGSQVGRFSSEPASGLTSCAETAGGKESANGSVALALVVGDGVKRIDGTEVALRAPWQSGGRLGPIGMMGTRPMTAAQRAEEKAAAEKAATEKAKAEKAAAEKAAAETAQAEKAAAEKAAAEKAAAEKAQAEKAAAEQAAAEKAAAVQAAAEKAAAEKAFAEKAAAEAAEAEKISKALVAAQTGTALEAEAAPAASAPEAAAPEASPAAEAAPARKARGPVVVEVEAGEGVPPQGLDAPRDGKADDLQKMEGIGPVLERICHDLGVFHFDQIAQWGAEEVAWMDTNLKGFRGRVSRDKWVAQAKIIVEEGLERFLERAKTNDY